MSSSPRDILEGSGASCPCVLSFKVLPSFKGIGSAALLQQEQSVMAEKHGCARDNLRGPQCFGRCADEESTANQDVAGEAAEDAASDATPDSPDEAEEGPEGGAYTGPSAGCTAVRHTSGTTQLSFQVTTL